MKKITLIMAFSFCIASFAQRTIKGIVTDQFGPLEGATILLKNKDLGAVTASDGSYQITAISTDTLLISYVGYKPLEISVGTKTAIDIILEGSIALDELLLIGYGSHVTTRSSGCGFTRITTSCQEESEIFNEVSSRFEPKLFPNPSTDGTFQLDLGANYQYVEFSVTSFSGQIIQKNTFHNVDRTITIDLSHLPSGLYLINTSADGQRLKTKRAIRS